MIVCWFSCGAASACAAKLAIEKYDPNDPAGVSDSQRYKMLGNGWTVDVIAHLLKGLK